MTTAERLRKIADGLDGQIQRGNYEFRSGWAQERLKEAKFLRELASRFERGEYLVAGQKSSTS